MERQMSVKEAIKIVEDAGYIVIKDIGEIKQLAIDAGYRVSDLIEVKADVDSIPKLVSYFYSRLYRKYPNRMAIPNYARDNSIAKQLVQSRMQGVNEKVAMQECVDIVDVIFDSEEEFDFQHPIKDIGILGQSKLGWVTEKAVSLLNRRREEEEKRWLEKRFQEIEDAYEVDLKAQAMKLQRMLDNIEAHEAKSREAQVG